MFTKGGARRCKASALILHGVISEPKEPQRYRSERKLASGATFRFNSIPITSIGVNRNAGYWASCQRCKRYGSVGYERCHAGIF